MKDPFLAQQLRESRRNKSKIHASGHPKCEGHVTPNEDEYQKSARLKFRYCLGVS